MQFKPELLEKILEGEKTVTRRKNISRYRVSGVYSIQPGRGKKSIGKIRIKDIRQETLHNAMDVREAFLEGFHTPRDLLDYWKQLHHQNDDQKALDEIIWRIEFELIFVKDAHTIASENPEFFKFLFQIEEEIPEPDTSKFFDFMDDFVWYCIECGEPHLHFMIKAHPESDDNICYNCHHKKYPERDFWREPA